MRRRITLALGALAAVALVSLPIGASALPTEERSPTSVPPAVPVALDAESGDGAFSLTSALTTPGDAEGGGSSDTQDAVTASLEGDGYECLIKEDLSGTMDATPPAGCEESGGITTAALTAAASEAFTTLVLEPLPIQYQPDGTWALINIDFIVMVDPQPQLLTSSLFDIPVTIRATPVHYSWDFGDGSPPLVTTDPGNPYPNQTVTHIYTEANEGVSVTLTTSWLGELMIADSGVWLPIAGFAQTTTTTEPIEIVAMEVHLVPNPEDR